MKKDIKYIIKKIIIGIGITIGLMLLKPYIAFAATIDLGTPTMYTSAQQGITTKLNDDGSITFTGTTTSSYANLINRTSKNIEKGTYTFSISQKLNCNIVFRTYYSDGSYINHTIEPGNTNIAFTIEKDAVAYSIYLSGFTASNPISLDYTIYYLLNEGKTSSTFSNIPYTDIPYVQFYSSSNTLVSNAYYTSTYTLGGIQYYTYTSNSSGTATSIGFFIDNLDDYDIVTISSNRISNDISYFSSNAVCSVNSVNSDQMTGQIYSGGSSSTSFPVDKTQNGQITCTNVGNNLSLIVHLDSSSSIDTSSIVIFSASRFKSSESSINESVQENTDSINKQTETLNDDDTSESTSTASSFFDSFSTSDNGGLSSIISSPLSFIQQLSSSTCTPLSLTVPYVNKTFELPCMSEIYSSNFGTFYNIYQTIVTGIIGYWVVIKLYAFVKEFKDPENDKLEVLEL